jgi:hypothetical protein
MSIYHTVATFGADKLIKYLCNYYGGVMVFNATFNNISVLLVEETGVSGKKPQTCRKLLCSELVIHYNENIFVFLFR